MGPDHSHGNGSIQLLPKHECKGIRILLDVWQRSSQQTQCNPQCPRRYLGDATGFPDLEALKNMYQMVAQQLMNSRECYVKANKYNKIPDHGILVGDLVLVKDHTAKSFEPKYKEDFRVVQIYGTNALQVSDKRGKLHNVHITDVKRVTMTEKVTKQLEEIYNQGRTAKNLIPQGLLPDQGWKTDQQEDRRQTLPREKTMDTIAMTTTLNQTEGPPSSCLRSKTKQLQPAKTPVSYTHLTLPTIYSV